MKVLKIPEEGENKTTFDEYMKDDGSWNGSEFNYCNHKIRKINMYESDDFDYFITEDNEGDHMILRSRK